MVLSSVSGFAGPLMYLFPNWTALPRGQPVDGRLGGTIDISELCSGTRLNPPAKGVRPTLQVDRKIEAISEQPKQIPWTISP